MSWRRLRAVGCSTTGARLLGTALVVAGGLCVSVLLWSQARSEYRREIVGALSDLADRQGEILEVQMTRAMGSLYAIASFMRTGSPVGPAAFQRFVSDALAREPEVRALGWSPRVVASDKAEVERLLRDELDVG